jgi:hypothetical protein
MVQGVGSDNQRCQVRNHAYRNRKVERCDVTYEVNGDTIPMVSSYKYSLSHTYTGKMDINS